MYRQSLDFGRLRFSRMGKGIGSAPENMAAPGDESEPTVFKNLTGTYRLPLNMVFMRISAQMKMPVSDFYRRLSEHFEQQEKPEGTLLWQQTVEEMGELFDAEDRELFSRLGHFIGIQDIQIQASAVEACREEIRERISMLEAERPGRERLYRVLSLTVGGFLVILFI